MPQRIVVMVAASALLAIGMAIATDSSPQGNPNQPPIVLSPLGRGNREFLYHDIKTYSYGLSGPRPISDEAAARIYGRTPRLNEAWAALEIGNRQWDSGNHPAAIAQWRVVARDYPATDAALAALAHIAQDARLRGDMRAATIAYAALVGHPDPPHRARSFFPFSNSNDKHSACVELSDISIKTNDLRNALKYAKLALDPYGNCDTCGVAVVSVDAAINQRIQSLKQAIAERRTVRLE